MASNIIYKLAEDLPSAVPRQAGLPGVQPRAEAEVSNWAGLTETSSAALPTLARYWRTVGKTDWTPAGTPWSAAFVSEVMQPYGLPPRSAHYQYAQAVVGGNAQGWTAYQIDGPVHLATGDILLRPRGSGTPADEEYWWSHGDIVFKVDRRAHWVGGNLGDRLKTGSYGVGPDGADLGGDYVLLLRPPQKKSVLPGLIGLALLAVVLKLSRG